MNSPNATINQTNSVQQLLNQDVKDYIKEAEQQLHKKEFYKILHSDPTETNKNQQIKQLVDKTLKRKNYQKNRKNSTSESPKTLHPKSIRQLTFGTSNQLNKQSNIRNIRIYISQVTVTKIPFDL